MKELLKYLWQLPQNLVGLLLVGIYQPDRFHTMQNGNIICYSYKMKGGISLGRYIIVNQFSSKETIKHEYGHCKQSKMLGWLYLPLVGLPSLLHAWLHECDAVGKTY